MGNREQLLELADLFAENEETLAEYYSLCNKKMDKYRDTWTRLETCEKKHADIFRKLKLVIEKQPFKWQVGKFSPLAIKLMIDQTKANIEKLKNGTIVNNYALTFIRDIENSLIESNLINAFKTENIEWQGIFSDMQEDSQWHKQAIMKIIQEEM